MAWMAEGRVDRLEEGWRTLREGHAWLVLGQGKGTAMGSGGSGGGGFWGLRVKG